MKKITLIFALFIAQFSFGQEMDTAVKKRANEVGLEFFGFIDGQTLITYECSFGKHWSGLIGAGPKSKEGLVNISGIDGSSIQTGDLFYTGFKVLMEGRDYLNEHTNGRATGFYFGLLTKFSDFNSDLVGIYTDSAGNQFNVNFDAGINVVSVGFLIGYKLSISKRLAIDFLMAGPGAGNYRFNIQNKSDDLPEEFFDDLNETLESISILDLIDSDFEFNRSKQRSNFTVPSFRYAIG